MFDFVVEDRDQSTVISGEAVWSERLREGSRYGQKSGLVEFTAETGSLQGRHAAGAGRRRI